MASPLSGFENIGDDQLKPDRQRHPDDQHTQWNFEILTQSREPNTAGV
jgi:hypothetical protein